MPAPEPSGCAPWVAKVGGKMKSGRLKAESSAGKGLGAGESVVAAVRDGEEVEAEAEAEAEVAGAVGRCADEEKVAAAEEKRRAREGPNQKDNA